MCVCAQRNIKENYHNQSVCDRPTSQNVVVSYPDSNNKGNPYSKCVCVCAKKKSMKRIIELYVCILSSIIPLFTFFFAFTLPAKKKSIKATFCLKVTHAKSAQHSTSQLLLVNL